MGTTCGDNPYASAEDREWAQNTLRYKWRNIYGAVPERSKRWLRPSLPFGKLVHYNTLNSESYVVEYPDAIEPADENAFTVFRYSENNLSAGVIYKGEQYGTAILGFPIEAIKGTENRNNCVRGTA